MPDVGKKWKESQSLSKRVSNLRSPFTRHSPEPGIVAQLVWNDASGESQRVTDPMQIIAELTNEGIPGAAPCQETAIRRMRIEETKES